LLPENKCQKQGLSTWILMILECTSLLVLFFSCFQVSAGHQDSAIGGKIQFPHEQEMILECKSLGTVVNCDLSRWPQGYAHQQFNLASLVAMSCSN
jgi:hypothetical protein